MPFSSLPRSATERSMPHQRATRTTPILMYHSIAADAGTAFKRWTVTPGAFAAQMAYLAAHQYTPITVTSYVEAITHGGQSLPLRPVVLTFDDGFADFAAAAWPVLQQYGFTATLYIATAFVGATSRWLQREGEADRPMLTWSAIAALHAGGIECGGHTHSHQPLDTLPAAAAWREITSCKQILEQRIGQAVPSFAYPFGYYNAATRRMIQEAGYTSACAVRYAISSLIDDPFALARLIVPNDMTIPDFAALIQGQRRQLHPLVQRARAPLWRFVRRHLLSVKGTML